MTLYELKEAVMNSIDGECLLRESPKVDIDGECLLRESPKVDSDLTPSNKNNITAEKGN